MSYDYENETCEGCVMMSDANEGEWDCCHPTGSGRYCVSPHASDDQCDGFAPSLQCRQVRALERIAAKINEPPMVFIPESSGGDDLTVSCDGKHGPVYFDNPLLDAEKEPSHGPKTQCSGCGETIPAIHKRYCRSCASSRKGGESSD